MKIVPRDVVAAYKALRVKVEKSNFPAKEAFLLFFLQRMSAFCVDGGLITAEQHKIYLEAFLNMVSVLDKSIAEKYAIMAKTNAESAGVDGDKDADMGYFSILCYSFTFLLTQQNDYVNYAFDRYLGSLESYLIDRGGTELDNEITNIELLTVAVADIEVRQDFDSLPALAAWAVSVMLGQKLREFSS